MGNSCCVIAYACLKISYGGREGRDDPASCTRRVNLDNNVNCKRDFDIIWFGGKHFSCLCRDFIAIRLLQVTLFTIVNLEAQG
jgi:hypothetical protein